ncbi:hypothetical protein BTO32_12205 [Marinobacter lutaoensis]|uniref:Uncharacterized protein n=1 Tax=Marinobacter lutaoensis TaxID=135739 RepID=A0A1V2DSI6_9GAMM|nr:hypothetical protein [Marinobacter lutaoensis]ONF43430.1 hypothetical protein BTO32_12205 [Marinobacter lutaoensis]
MCESSAVDLVVDDAVQGLGITQLFEQWLAPYLQEGTLEPVLESWCHSRYRGVIGGKCLA